MQMKNQSNKPLIHSIISVQVGFDAKLALNW